MSYLKLVLIIVALVVSIMTTMKNKKIQDQSNNPETKSAFGMSLAVTILLALILVLCLFGMYRHKEYRMSGLQHYL